MPPRILLTGFKPFGEVVINPTERLMHAAAQAVAEFPAAIETLVLDTAYKVCEEQFARAVQRFAPAAIISFGLRFRTDEVCLERITINLDDAPLPDTRGSERHGTRIAEAGPVGYWSTLPLERMYFALQEAGIPVRFSNHAGAYVCNHLFYYGRHLIEAGGLSTLIGFVHMPPLPEQLTEGEDERAGMDLETQLRAARICVGEVAAYVRQR